jgi:adenine phosphoribosyltransferase
MSLSDRVRTVPDYPKQGILFRDVTTLFRDAEAFEESVTRLAKTYESHQLDAVAGIEARGFILGAPLALALGVGFVTIRKPGKLPSATVGRDYTLEYGTDRVEMHVDAVQAGQCVLVVDDLLATGGTALAVVELLRDANAVVDAAAFLVDLPDLGGSSALRRTGVEPTALISYLDH